MAKHTNAGKVRAALQKISPAGEEVSLEALAWELDWIFAKDKMPMYAALKDMRKSGEVERTRRGFIAYRGNRDDKPEVRDAMWSVLRMRKSVTINDLCELAHASHEYAREFLSMLVRRGGVEHIRRKNAESIYRLIKDTGPATPADTGKANKLRALREAKKRALAELESAGKMVIDAAHAVSRARIAVNDITEEETDADQ